MTAKEKALIAAKVNVLKALGHPTIEAVLQATAQTHSKLMKQ